MNYDDITPINIESENKDIEALKSTFRTFKRLYEADYKGPSDHWKFVWPKLLQVLRAANIEDHNAFMQAQFEAVGRSLRPNELTSDRAVERYFQFITSQEATVRLRLQLQAHKVKTRMQWKGYRETLTDRDEELEPLARVCFAADEKLDDVVQLFLEDAARQYASGSSVYDKVYGNIIPEVVRCRAKQLLHQIKNG